LDLVPLGRIVLLTHVAALLPAAVAAAPVKIAECLLFGFKFQMLSDI